MSVVNATEAVSGVRPVSNALRDSSSIQICGNDTIEDQKTLPERVAALSIKVPSVSATRDYMRAFHNGKEDVNRGAGRNFIPAENI
jgi:hypothetical protein